MDSNYILSLIGRWAMALLAAVWAIIEPSLPYLLLCTGFIFLDCYSAWRLAKRVKKAHPTRATGKLVSEKMRHVFRTLAEVYAVVLLVYYAQVHITGSLPFDLTKVVAGAVCGWQFWSYLENSASCNGAKWAKAASKILIDKTSRHFDIDIHDIIPDSNANN